jgi:hypothetical protein
MAVRIKDSTAQVLKALWDIENELRGAARSGVILRGDDARMHLRQARLHLDRLLHPAAPTTPGATEKPIPAVRPALTIDNQSISRSDHHGT